MNSIPLISQTKLNVLQEQVCRPFNYLSKSIDSATSLWDGPIKMCQQIETDPFAVDSVVMNARQNDSFFNGNNTPRFYHAILCRVYILLYYRHRDKKIYQEIVFPRLKENMGIYNNVHLSAIHNQIDKILAQEELLKKMQEERKKDVKPVFSYVAHNGDEQDHLAIEYNEEQLFRNMSGVIRELAKKYDTHQDDANVWYNAKQVVRTLRDVNHPELLIKRAALALMHGQLYNPFEGSQIILISAYAMIRSSKNNDHFSAFIQKMESLANADTDMFIIRNSIDAISNWITQNLPFENSEYIGEETSKVENYTIADIERIRREYEEKIAAIRSENTELMEENKKIKKENESLTQQIEEGSSEDIKWHDKVRLELLLSLMKKDGANLDIYGNKIMAARVMQLVTSLPLQTCKNYCSNAILSKKEHEEEIVKLNLKLHALGMKIQL